MRLKDASAVRPAGLALLLFVGACSDPGPVAPAPLPAGPGPELYLGAEVSASRRAARAIVDAGTIWLVDEHGDFVRGADPAANWSAASGLSLAWTQIAGATKYRVMGRDHGAEGGEWKELAAIAAPDPKLEPTAVATGVNPWSAKLGTGGYPWSFGNRLDIAISAENDKGPLPGSSLTDVLSTTDAFPGVLTSVAVDPEGLPVPFAVSPERGATVVKTFRLGFSEPMTASSPPTLTPRSARVAIRRVLASAWGASADAPSATPISAGAHAFLRVELAVRGPCTELLVPRRATDLVLPVRDPSLAAVGAATRLLFLAGDDGAYLGEAVGVKAVDSGAGRLALASGLEADLPAGALVCATVGPGAAAFVSTEGPRVTVSDATAFHAGQRLVIHRPATASASALVDLATVAGVDTVAKVVVLSTAPSAGHDATSAVLPVHGIGAEVALRPSAELALERDAVGGAAVELFVDAAATAMVGDTLLVDGDGDLDTTPDQALATVTAVRLARTGSTGASIVVDLPSTMILLHGEARVVALGDAFGVGGTRDTSAAEPAPLDPHRDAFSPDGLLW